MKVKESQVLFLNDEQIKSLVSSETVLRLTEKSFEEYAKGCAINPVKLHLPAYPKYEGYVNSMPAYLTDLDIMGAKIVSVYRDNAQYHLPSTIGTIILHDPKTGNPYALMNGTYVTSARTGAVMGVMAKYCAKKNAKSLTIIGAGAQGFSAFHMVCLALPQVNEICVVDIKEEAQDRFIADAKKLFPDKTYTKCSDIQTACTSADLVLSTAGGERPLLADIKFAKGATVLDVAETYGGTFVKKFDKYIGDFKECLVERINDDAKHHCEATGAAYDGLELSDVSAEIGNIIIGKETGRENDDEIILASSVGMGIQDLMVAHEAYEKALAQDVGTVLDF